MVVSIVLISQLLGCNTGDDNSGGSAGGNLTPEAVVDVDINGSVGDGPIVGATVEIYNNSGKMLSSVMSDVAASYTINIKTKGRDYPLLLKVSGGTDMVTGNVPDFQLLSVALNPSEKSVNINPFSTLVVKMTQSMAGGVNAANVSAAKTIITDSFAFGLDPSVVSDPIIAQITESNAANIVKASEVFGEMVRRTRDALLTAGTVVSGDAVMSAIAADLTDGVLDGSGAGGVLPTISATAKVVSAQVLVEALSNNLKVGGVVATEVIDQSIASTRPGVLSSQLTGSVRITSGMLDQTLIALAAAQVLDSGAAVQNIESSVTDITPNALPAELVTVLPADASAGLDKAVTLTPYASTGDIDAINQIVDFTGSVGTTSGETTFNGTIDTPTGNKTITVGDFINFTGTYSAPDGDPVQGYLWEFGSGSGLANSSAEDPGQMQFNNTGVFTVKFTVTDSNGAQDPTPAQVTVTVVAQGSIIMDNSDAGFSTAGNWQSSTSIAGYYGSDYQIASTGDGSSTATWQFNIATTGKYDVEAQWAAYVNRATDAPYTLYNNGIFVARVTKNQQINGGQFNLLGSYNLTEGTLEVVLDNNASGYVVANAVQVTYTGATSNQLSDGTTSGGTTTDGTTSGGTTTDGTTSGGTTTDGTTSGGTTTDGTTSGGTTTDGTTSGGTTSGGTTSGGTTTDGTTSGGTTSGGTTSTDTITDIIIVDNSDAVFSTVGDWPSSAAIAGYYGSDYQIASTGDGSSTATWQFNITTTGNYNVEPQWTTYSNRATDAPYTLYNNGILVARVTKNQQTNGGQFNTLDPTT